MENSPVLPDRRQRVMLNIPDDFLRIPLPDRDLFQHNQENVGPHPQGQQQGDGVASTVSRATHRGSRQLPAIQQGKLSVTVAQAKLGKNYGLTRMDPYARIRIGHYVFETDTDTNGATNPRWDKTFTCYVPPGINSIYVEIYDERTFAMDERIAWGHFTIPQRVFEGDALDDWWQLSGKQGDQKEGMIEIVFSYERVQAVPYCMPGGGVVMMTNQSQYAAMPGMPGMAVPGFYPPMQTVAGAVAATHPQPTTVVPITEEDVKQLKEMFPNVDDEVIQSVLEEKNGNKSAAINGLLAMTEA